MVVGDYTLPKSGISVEWLVGNCSGMVTGGTP